MPIDFNSNVNINPNNFVAHKIFNNRAFLFNKNHPDTFTKSIDNVNISKDYSGIKITQKSFGKLQKTNEEAIVYTITNKNGASVDLSTFGATITSVKVPDKNGELVDVTQGYDNVTPYEMSPVGHAGATIGPVANKIDKGEFSLNGQTYYLEKNKDSGKTHCHGASNGFDIKIWSARILPDGVEFTYLKKDGEGGYPGNVKAKVTYKFDNDNNLRIIYSAQSDKDTLINMTNHTYFNLDGAKNTQENSVLNHIVTFPNSSTYTKNNEIAIPTGEIVKVENTVFDFRKPNKIANVINVEDDQLKIGSGFDQNYIIDGYDGTTLIEAANVKSDKTGINLKVSTNLPGFQFYTANHLGKSSQPNGKNSSRYEKRSALCIEPQFFPNAINTKEFSEKGILKQDQEYKREIMYSFSAEK